MKKQLLVFILLAALHLATAQSTKPVYNPCVLMDSVEKHLDFIRLNVSRIFSDTAECKQKLFDSIAVAYLQSNDKKYLDALAYMRNSGAADKVENLYTDVIRILVQNDFSGFLQQLYLARGKYVSLEKELVAAMNMIIDGRPYKQKYLGLLNIEISKATDAKESAKVTYLQKLKTRIEEDK
ncbi:MAG: hypothetical protein KIS94_12725 [Chitinophagales bacterium]|nr:hypothetical protein [Chitinophagales bacterium]